MQICVCVMGYTKTVNYYYYYSLLLFFVKGEEMDHSVGTESRQGQQCLQAAV